MMIHKAALRGYAIMQSSAIGAALRSRYSGRHWIDAL